MTEHLEIIDESQDLYEHYRFTADKGQGLLRIDKFLMARIENASRTKIQNASKAGNILVNGLPVRSNYKVKPDDVITIVLSFPPREIEIIPEDIPVEILYEDEDLIIVNKSAGMVVHPAYGNYRGTLVNALAFHFQSGLPGGSLIQAPYLVHRIDKDTSGVMVAAKNEIAQARLAKQFFDHSIERKYHALVWGDFDDDTGTITGNIGRNIHDRKKFAVFPDGNHGKHAVTHYRVLERFGYVTLVECQLETGRTHQIRTHFAWVKHPLFNDETYGGNVILKGTTFTKYRQFVNNCFSLIPRQALHAKSLGFLHPVTKKPIYFESDLPEDMAAVIEKWHNYVKSKNPGE